VEHGQGAGSVVLVLLAVIGTGPKSLPTVPSPRASRRRCPVEHGEGAGARGPVRVRGPAHGGRVRGPGAARRDRDRGSSSRPCRPGEAFHPRAHAEVPRPRASRRRCPVEHGQGAGSVVLFEFEALPTVAGSVVLVLLAVIWTGPDSLPRVPRPRAYPVGAAPWCVARVPSSRPCRPGDRRHLRGPAGVPSPRASRRRCPRGVGPGSVVLVLLAVIGTGVRVRGPADLVKPSTREPMPKCPGPGPAVGAALWSMARGPGPWSCSSSRPCPRWPGPWSWCCSP